MTFDMVRQHSHASSEPLGYVRTLTGTIAFHPDTELNCIRAATISPSRDHLVACQHLRSQRVHVCAPIRFPMLGEKDWSMCHAQHRRTAFRFSSQPLLSLVALRCARAARRQHHRRGGAAAIASLRAAADPSGRLYLDPGLLGMERRYRLLLGARHVGRAAARRSSLDTRLLGLERWRLRFPRRILGSERRILRRHRLWLRLHRPRL